MPSSSPRNRRILLAVAAAVALAIAAFAFVHYVRNHAPLPQPGTSLYEDYAEAFQVGTAALDSGSLNQIALEKLTQAIEIIPQEPAAWANRGICYLRIGNPASLDNAETDLQRAKELATGNVVIEELQGYLAERQGKLPEAVTHLRTALRSDPDNAHLLYKLSELIEKEDTDSAHDEQLKLFDRILAVRPKSLFTLSNRAGLAVRLRDQKTLRDTVNRLSGLSDEWHADTRAALAALRKDALEETMPPTIMGRLIPLQNLLKQETGFSNDSNEINPAASAVGTPFQSFLSLAPIHARPDPPDLGLTLVEGALSVQAGAPKRLTWDDPKFFPMSLDGKEKPAILLASALEVWRYDAAGPALPFPSGPKNVMPTIDGVLAIDWNNDELIDLVLAGAGGLRFFKHSEKGFEDVTAKTKLPPEIVEGDHYGAWAADVEMDGDLDIIVAPRKGRPLLLRNNFDDTFTVQSPFPGVEGVRAFAWVDLDNDGAPDAVFLDVSGKLHVFMNRRSGVFQHRASPDPNARYAALAVADVRESGVFDIVAVRQDGVLVRISDKEKGQSWEVADLGKLEKKLPLVPGECRLIAVDIDNNGSIDLVLRTDRGGQIWLADGKGSFRPLGIEVPDGTADVVSLEENGTLDFLGWRGHPAGMSVPPARWTTKPTLDYHWQNLRPRASPGTSGDNRINSMCLGGYFEVRTGSLVVKQPIDRPVLHVGLGRRNVAAVIRFVWPNGAVQFELNKETDRRISVTQRLKGSCPFLFTYDGKQMVFVADFCWSTPLGMYINGQDKGGFLQTTDWVKIRGDQLVPRDGYYDLRVNANLWETHFLDHLSLMVVDHSPGTEVHVDERFFLSPTELQLYLTGPPRPVARAWDHKGADVTDIVRAVDGRYLDRAGRGIYQGITADHWVEVDLGDDVPKEGPVYLLAHGWIHPTDSSINRAIEQGKHPRPMPLTLEVPDGKGGWKVGRPALGFPAGKNKTCVIRLDGIEGKGVSRHFRLRTNLEIFWDALMWAPGLDASRCVCKQLRPDKAELYYRGLIRMSQAGPSEPELPHYDEVVCRTQYWRDLIGFHTRFGDVKELLEKIDDRYVIMNAGDEIRLRFTPPPEPAAGWKRDFVWVCDGWVKDGDLNTRFGNTVLPLPYHGMKSYDTPPGRLQDDPVYRRFPKDWEFYHTRWVAPTVFERGLRNFARPRE